ncbi:hypothetical protein Daura_18205 [Dactylosporangium aurantiacum]|uniref:Flavodoxin domain-containing protein n=1 Tax=Dactylosporangium aurantiacum TaxID=35754 RepID=A0A9Q9IS01_9ACTN|nr:flavodoxin domain-containing protein [Dactylosporangium aurantiacum]MDG6105897.1 flavodoxin domain-containing protein [Dactylosporangium aurantiacum]UWZ57928.1 hypothetical protein Daura_18205 [Dactylosporangium aurantiacum]
MRVLVAYTDDDGASADTARLIGDTLHRHGLDSVVREVPAERTGEGGIGGFDAVVLGGPARGGHWPRRTVRFAMAQRQRLRRVPVWLFSNSPAGDAVTPQQRIDIGAVEDAVEALDHRPFLAAHPPGRPWAPHALEPDPGEVRGWARHIAAALRAGDPPPDPTNAAPAPDARGR